MEIKAALPPPKIRLNSNIRKYAFRALKLSSIHLINIEIDGIQSFRDEHQIQAIKPTQLERIYDSIQGLVDLDSLKQIQHYYYSP
jgi:hypothetical protein